MRRLLVAKLLAALLLCGCAGSIHPARKAAAADHGCPLDRVKIFRDASWGGVDARWLRVCGKSRMYRFVADPKGGGRYVDATDSVRK